MLGRIFRARERRLAAGKMVAWARRRYVDAQPLAGRRPLAAQRRAADPWSELGDNHDRREEHACHEN